MERVCSIEGKNDSHTFLFTQGLNNLLLLVKADKEAGVLVNVVDFEFRRRVADSELGEVV